MPKKLTTSKFVENANKIHNNKYDYSLVEYINNKTKVKIICPEHGIFYVRPDNHNGGKSGCPKCVNNQKYSNGEFIKKANKIHNNKYDYSLVEYINNKTKVKIICPEHGKFEQLAGSHLSGYNCIKCSGLNILTKKEFIEKANKIHNNKYDYSLVEYKNSTSKVRIICPEHGLFEQLATSHLKGYNCIKCRGLNKKNSEEFIEKANKIHNNKYDYSLVKYKNNKTRIKIICPKHGQFIQIANSHLSKAGCKKCADDLKKLNIDDFINQANKIHNNKYDYSLVNYINSYTKIKIVCVEHGIFKQTPHSHLLSRGCKYCKISKGEEQIISYFKNNNIKFEHQFNFDDCKDKNKLPFDFFLNNYNMCIEYDGRQHFECVEYFGGLEKFEQIQKHDKIKNLFCDKNNIKLLRIKYNENINDKLNEIFSKLIPFLSL